MKGYKPVSIVALAGPQGTMPVKCDLKILLFFANLSKFGVKCISMFHKTKAIPSPLVCTYK